ncbi:ubiquitin-like protein ATG12 [Cyprinus carpio]|uniref:Ubiquitin-like protein ATG12 n=1 Tax=Cyprinus carpio TaxID=7962 RepID=A0A8C1C0M7_CYPCA|nr:ubiquitin-like protein ATG12 [Cyprinus carpio]
MSDHAESPTENQKDDPSIQHTATEHTGSSDVGKKSMFIYVNQSFAPSPDQEVGVLFECFGSDGKLVLHYCKSQAWR